MDHIPWLLAAPDVGEIFGIIILVLTGLAWFVRVIKGEGGNPPAGRNANADRVKSDIESFLEEISGKAGQRPPARPNRPNPPNRPPNRPPIAKAPKKPNQPLAGGKPSKSGKGAKASKPGEALAETHLSTSNLGSGVGSHVSSYMQTDRVAAEVQQDLRSRIADEVQADLGSARLTAAVPTEPRRVHPLVALLRDPQGVRQAIALQEILQKPKSLRRGE